MNPLEQVAESALAPEMIQPSTQRNGSRFNLRAFLDAHGIRIARTLSYTSGTGFELETCPFNPEHKNSAILHDRGDEEISFSCYLNGCKGKQWSDARDRIERSQGLRADPARLNPLAVVAEWSPTPHPPPAASRERIANGDIIEFIQRHDLKVRRGPVRDGAREMWELDVCPFNPEHTGGCAAIFGSDNGTRGFKCHHKSCEGKGWRELNAHLNGGPPAGENDAAEGESSGDDTSNVGWPKPTPLAGALPPVMPFREELLPVSFRPLVRDVAERMQVPMDFPGVVNVLSLAGIVNRRAEIQPKKNDTSWRVVPNLWGGIVAPPGYLKSPLIAAVTRPIIKIQAERLQKYQLSMERYEREKEEYDLRVAVWKDEYKKAAKKHTALPARPDNESAKPELSRLVVNDATFEALHQTMSQNPAGILVIRDELTGWWNTLDKPGREGERAFCLEAWNGDSSFTVDRIGRGTVHVPHCCMSMLGGIQPGRFRSYLGDALHDGPANDGLIQRFGSLVWPDTNPEWEYVDRAPNAAAEELVETVFRRLVELDVESPLRFRFAPDAQQTFENWLGQLERRLRSTDLHPALISHLSKYRKLMPALSLLFELADRASYEGFDGTSLGKSENFVSLEHTRQAVEWCEYLESHAVRMYSCLVAPQINAAQELAKKIKEGKVGDENGQFKCRNVYLNGWSGLDTPEAVKPALEVLQDAGWIRAIEINPGPNGGRPPALYQINPRVWE